MNTDNLDVKKAMTQLSSTSTQDRIHSLDLLRGFALLGILIMNIISFSNIGYLNPTIGAGLEGYNTYVHGFGYLFADTRFMSIFSILFGAGVVLFADNAIKKNKNVWKYHYRRMFLLLLFGMIHAYCIWMGDILVAYAVCGSFVFFWRNWKLRSLATLGSILFLVPVLFTLMTYYFTPADQLQEIFSFWTPTQDEIDKETAAYLGGFFEQNTERIPGAIEIQTFVFIMSIVWRVSSMMILGMILYRTGVLTAEKPNGLYKKMVLISLPAGLIIASVGLYLSYQNEWDGVWCMNIGENYKYFASILVALGYIGAIMLWSKTDWWSGLQLRLRAVGRLAFTNYILMSVICTFIFYGHGLGLFGTFDRLQQLGVVVVIWVLLLIMSPLILQRYRQGPLEWLWRKLTYLN